MLKRFVVFLLLIFYVAAHDVVVPVVAQSGFETDSRGKDGDDNDDDDNDDNDSDDDDSGGDSDNSGSGSDNSGGGSDDDSDSDDSDSDNSGGDDSGGDSSSDDSSSDSDSDGSDSDSSGDDGNSGSGNNGSSGSDNSGNSGGGNTSGNSGDNDSDDDSDNDDSDNSGGGNSGDDNSGNGNSGNDDTDDEAEDTSGNDNSDDDYEEDDRHYYVGSVSANDGSSVLMGGTRLQSTSPWLELLDTGMLFEAYGYWQSDDTFIADEINVIGEDWAYLRSPGVLLGESDAQVEAWTRGETVETLKSVSNEVTQDSVRVVAYFDGSKIRGLPKALTPPLPDLPSGWVEFTGRFDGDGVVWETSRAFP